MGNSLVAIQVLMQLLAQAQMFGNLIRQARERGTDITDYELNALVVGDDAAKAALDSAIAAANLIKVKQP